jgi:hypothetical protein
MTSIVEGVGLEIGAGQVLEQHIEAGVEEITAAVANMGATGPVCEQTADRDSALCRGPKSAPSSRRPRQKHDGSE